MSNGRLEGLITIPAGGWDMAVNGSGETIPAGQYSWDDLILEIEDRFSGIAAGFTVSLSRGENGTGRVTLSAAANFTLTWIDLELRDLLGFTANLAGDDVYTSPGTARALWIATCPYVADNEIHPWVGWPTADFRSVESAAGDVWAFSGSKKDVASLRWEAIRRSRVIRAEEAFAGESFQRFVEDNVWGLAAWGTPGGPVRFFPDADATAWVSYFVTDLATFKPEHWADGWAGGPWQVQLPRLVFAASSEGGEDPGPGEPPPPSEECQTLFTGNGPPPVDFPGDENDLYLDLDTGTLYEFTE